VPSRSKNQEVVSNAPDNEPRGWNELAHDIANDLGALKLLITAVGMAADDGERSRHLGMAKQTIVEVDSRLQALREAVRRELGAGSKAPTPSATEPRPRERAKAGR
jgi:hypothetical protein